MKVDPPAVFHRLASASKVRKIRRRGGFPLEAHSISDLDSSSVVMSSSASGSLLSLQSVDETPPEFTALEKSELTLELLQGLRLSLFEGGLSRNQLNQIATLAASQINRTDDQALLDILREIVTHAEAELAKYN